MLARVPINSWSTRVPIKNTGTLLIEILYNLSRANHNIVNMTIYQLSLPRITPNFLQLTKIAQIKYLPPLCNTTKYLWRKYLLIVLLWLEKVMYMELMFLFNLLIHLR
jgi:hypothetical protein